MVWATLRSSTSHCRFYARRLSRHILLPGTALLGYRLFLEIFPSWRFYSCFNLSPRLGSYQCWLLVEQSAPQGHPRLCSCTILRSILSNSGMSCVSVRQFPSLSCMVLVCPCFVFVRVFTSWYAFLLLFFLMLSSISWHCTSIQDSFAWLTALHFSAPSSVSCLPFFRALRFPPIFSWKPSATWGS